MNGKSPLGGGTEISAGYPFESVYVEVLGSRLHYVEEGEGDPILFVHGNPTWSYVWRNIIPYAAGRGRAIALDLVGMGKSGKPDIEYRFIDHAKYLEGFIDKLGLRNLTLVVHDWGSALGLQYAARRPSNVRGIAMMEPMLWIANLKDLPEPVRGTFTAFRTPGIGWDMVAKQNLVIERSLPAGIVRNLTEEEMARYREPFPNPESRKPVWRWTNEVPFDRQPRDVADAVEAYVKWLKGSDVPKLLFYGNPGQIVSADRVEWCRQNLANLSVVGIGPGRHFLQEDNPHLIGRELAKWYNGLSSNRRSNNSPA